MSLSPTQRTLQAMRRRGLNAAVVEKWNQHVGPHGIRQDLFGIIDVIALDHQTGVIGIQSCAGSGFSAHWKKLTEERAQETSDWLNTPGCTLELWGWRKVKLHRGGKAERWEPRVKVITLEDICQSEEAQCEQ